MVNQMNYELKNKEESNVSGRTNLFVVILSGNFGYFRLDDWLYA